MQLDYSLTTPEERTAFVNKIVQQADPATLTPKYLSILSDYIFSAINKQQRKQRKILTDNRLVTVNKRETSYQGLVAKLESGEDGIYNLIAVNARNILLAPKARITPKDIDEIPGLKQLTESIQRLEKDQKAALGKRKYLLKKQLIQMRQQQYILKNDFHQPIYCANAVKTFGQIEFPDDISIVDGRPINKGPISFFNPDHISAILCNYTALRTAADHAFTSDAWHLMLDFQALLHQALAPYPLYYDLVLLKICGAQNIEIQQQLEQRHSIKHTIQYISSLWRNKIPRLIAQYAERDYIVWYYTNIERGEWKRCSRCGEVKLVNNMFFSRNASSSDGFYSICKTCRNAAGQTPLSADQEN